MASKVLIAAGVASLILATAALAQAGAPPTGAAAVAAGAQPGRPAGSAAPGAPSSRLNGASTTPGMNPSQPGYAGAAPVLTPPAATAITPPSSTTPGAIGLPPPGAVSSVPPATPGGPPHH